MQDTSAGGSLATDGIGDTPPPQSQDGVAGYPDSQPGQQQGQQYHTPPANGSVRVALSEDLRSIPSLAKYMDQDGKVDPNVLANSYVHAERMIGQNRIPVPKDENDTESLEKAYTALGRPAKPEDYKIDRPEKMPAGIEYDEDGEKHLRQLGWQNGFNNRQIKAMRDAYLQREAERMENYHEYQQQARATAEETLRREHGHGYDKFIRTAKVALREFGDPDFFDYLNQTGLGNDPRLLRAFGKAGAAMIGEQKLREGAPTDGPADINEAIADFRTKHNTALMDSQHPEHEARTRELSRLFQRMYPE